MSKGQESRNAEAKRSKRQSGAEREPDEELDFGPFFQYLSTANGHEIASKVVGIIDDIKKVTLAQSSSHAKLETSLKILVILAVIAAASLLTFWDKLSPTTGVLFGTLVGYIFGKK